MRKKEKKEEKIKNKCPYCRESYVEKVCASAFSLGKGQGVVCPKCKGIIWR